MFKSYSTIKITVFHSENGLDRSQNQDNFTVFSPFCDDSATVLYVYNIVYIVVNVVLVQHSVYSKLFIVG